MSDTDTAGQPEPEPEQPQGQGEPDDEPLGEGGKKALDRERQARKDAERRARELEDRLTQVEAEQTRSSVAAEKGLTAEQARLLAGDDREAMEAHADELLGAFQPEPEAGTRRPQERLRSGAVPDSEPDRTASEVAEEIMSGW